MDLRPITGELSKYHMRNDFRDDHQQYREIPYNPQSSLSVLTAIDSTGPQEFGSHSHVSHDWQASIPNPTHLSNWNGGQTLVDVPNLGWDQSVHNAGGIQNSNLIRPGQLLQGGVEISTLTTMGCHQSSSSGNYSVEDNTSCVPSYQLLPDGVIPDHEILDNNHIHNCDIVEPMQPSSSIPVDNSNVSTSVAPNQLFSIVTLSPNWAFSGDQIKVCVIGRFLISSEEVQKCKWTCNFGGVEVSADVIIEGVLQCQTPLHGNGIVQLYIKCSNGLQCTVGEFEFRPIQVVDVGNDASSQTRHRITRLQKLLYLESSTSQTPLESCSTKTLKLCTNISTLLEDNPKWEKPGNFTKLVECSASNVKDQCIKKLLQKQLRIWLFQKIAEGGRGASVLDGEGQGVLHLVAALGYNWAIKPILDSGIISIDLEDVNKYTALAWASLMGREDTVKLLEYHGATPRNASEPILSSASGINLDISRIKSMAKSAWLLPTVICGILHNHRQYPIETNAPIRPPSGLIFLFDHSIQPHFRNDGHKWLKESRSKKKILDSELITNYARGQENYKFSRRTYQLKTEPSNIVLVHYREEEKASNSSFKHRSNSTGGHHSDDNPDSGEEPHGYPPFGRPTVNQASKPNGVNQMEQSNAGGLQNSYLNVDSRVLLPDALKLSDVTSTECSSKSSCDGNFDLEDKENYSSSKQLLLDGLMHDEFEVINSLDCRTSTQLEDVNETTRPCLNIDKGSDGSEDGDDREHTACMLICPGANTGLVTDPTPKYSSGSTPKDLAEPIALQNSSRSSGKAVVTVFEQSTPPVGYDDQEFVLSDDHTLSLLPLRTKRAGQDSELIHTAAASWARIRNKFCSWKGRKDFLLARKEIIKIQAHVRGHQVRLRKALALGESMVRYPEEYNEVMNASEVSEKIRRRLAQDREAARKCRLRKKAYIQQLEQSRLKLTQLEQELKSARQQGIFISSTEDQTNTGSNNGAVAFDTEYARSMEEQNRLINELRTAVDTEYARWMEEQNRLINELRTAVDSRASDTVTRVK